MDVDELTETMHAASVPVPLDLDRVTRDGRRLRTRRRAVLAGGLAAAVAAVAVPVALLGQSGGGEPSYAGSPKPAPERTVTDDSRETQFEQTAPIGRPMAGVLQPGGAYAPKFYLGGDKVRSVGALSVWADQDEGLAFGARLVDGDGSLRQAGSLDLPTLAGKGETLVRIPFQNADEPTFVGLVDVPAGTRARDLASVVESEDSSVRTGVRTDVVAGKALVWATASSGSRPGIELTYWSVQLGDDVLASGGFGPQTSSAWAPMP